MVKQSNNLVIHSQVKNPKLKKQSQQSQQVSKKKTTISKVHNFKKNPKFSSQVQNGQAISNYIKFTLKNKKEPQVEKTISKNNLKFQKNNLKKQSKVQKNSQIQKPNLKINLSKNDLKCKKKNYKFTECIGNLQVKYKKY